MDNIGAFVGRQCFIVSAKRASSQGGLFLHKLLDKQQNNTYL